jgi:FSR family fosmidomycin resistance protein-like MFS transporter
MVAGLLAGLLLIPMLERIPGKKVLRISAVLALGVYAAWLAAPWLWAKVVLLAALPFATASWYPVLQGEAYAAAPGRSGTVMAVTSLAGLLGGALIWLVGWVAEAAGLPAAMALLLLGPVSLVLFVRE